jgi:hypothetical protein
MKYMTTYQNRQGRRVHNLHIGSYPCRRAGGNLGAREKEGGSCPSNKGNYYLRTSRTNISSIKIVSQEIKMA